MNDGSEGQSAERDFFGKISNRQTERHNLLFDGVLVDSLELERGLLHAVVLGRRHGCAGDVLHLYQIRISHDVSRKFEMKDPNDFQILLLSGSGLVREKLCCCRQALRRNG